MAGLDSNTQAVLVQYLDDSYPKTLIQKRPFFDRIKKIDSTGLSTKIPLNVGYGGGVSNSMATAIANAQVGGALHQFFDVPPMETFGVTILDNVQALYTQGANSAESALIDATQGATENGAQNLEALIFGSGYGDQATITANSNPSGSIYILTLSNQAEAQRFQPNMVIVSAATTAAALDSGTAKVNGLNQLGSQITVTASGGWTPTNTHIIGLQGQLLGSSTLSGPPGIFAFCPPWASRPATGLADTFLSCDRSVGGTGTAGWAYDGTGLPILEGINILASMMATVATATPDSAYSHPINVGKVASELKTQVRIDMPSVTDPTVFFSGVTVMTGAGALDLLAEASCPQKYVVVTKASSWTFGSPGNKPIRPSNLDGTMTTQDYGTNNTRFAVTVTGMFYTAQPQATGVLTVS
jgi:hypothetical protein